ncbi:xylose isomerase [bacterium]|nr:MAG: xylose isomerase [bacterium]
MKRRDFIRTGFAAAAVAALPGPERLPLQDRGPAPKPKTAFKLKYAPSIGQFKIHAGEDLLAQIRFAAGEGFGAMFDNGLMGRPARMQEAVFKELEKNGMAMGPFVLYADFGQKSFVTRDWDVRDMLLKKMRQGVECAKRVNAKWALVVPGRFDESLAWEYQTANVIENLRYCMEVCEPAGLVVVLEPLNPKDHPGLFLTRVPQAYEICRAVASPSCKIINDLYHQQITEGNLIPNIDAAWEEIAAYHIGDNPGRKEPGTGEINYRNIFKHLYQKGFQGVLGMEHGQSVPGKAGERAVIDAYKECDNY